MSISPGIVLLALIIGVPLLTLLFLSVFGKTSKSEGQYTRRVEAYILTNKGHERYEMRTDTEISYEGAIILAALMRHGKRTVGQLVDDCGHAYAPSLRREIDDLLEKGVIKRDDVSMQTIEAANFRKQWVL